MTAPELQVDLDALAANIAVVRARVAPAQLMLIVKDDAYGHGLTAVVTRAAAEGVVWFGAFDVREALRTRAAVGPKARVFSWLTVGADEITAALAADIDLGVGDAGFLEDIAAAARTAGAPARVHLKIDTGLHRNGIRPEEWDAILGRAQALATEGLLRVVGVWSHIAEASDAEDDTARALFEDAVTAAEAAGFALDVRHLSASAASFARPEFRYDLARVGAFCYGIRPAGGPGQDELGIRPVASLVATVTHVADYAVTLGVGSLHGLPSTLAQHAHLEVAGDRREVRHVGATHTMVAPWRGAAVGQRVAVVGPDGTSATDLAETIGTVGEELLVRVSPLVRRAYPGR
ncbi:MULTISPECIES: alanine racemase [unclassified Microbacterium]|uniref:alanine racemase n=1 Tax=unclassified Microbacterium TaxID=2609290 RepID=UPI00214C0971|nr:MULTISPECIES: alanine racemase [unclassified Microbacterium]MCR2811103.1 alanine racemase [Microbacterium sp. zg.B185]WIM20782.1 alanine racemase [Microbacterium sp. zg-B185]